jgi:hypothetical protein
MGADVVQSLIVADDGFKADLFAPISEVAAKSRSRSERLAVVGRQEGESITCRHVIERSFKLRQNANCDWLSVLQRVLFGRHDRRPSLVMCWRPRRQAAFRNFAVAPAATSSVDWAFD